MSPPRLDGDRLEVCKLDTSRQIPAFTCGDSDLDEFLRDDAAHLQDAGVTQVYLAWYESDLVGYTAILADAIELKINDVKCLPPLKYGDPKTIPAVKLGRIAVSVDFKARFSGCGTCLVQLVVDVAKSLSETVGCRLVTADAYRTEIGFYEHLGFRAKREMLADESRKTVPMWLDLKLEHNWI